MKSDPSYGGKVYESKSQNILSHISYLSQSDVALYSQALKFSVFVLRAF